MRTFIVILGVLTLLVIASIVTDGMLSQWINQAWICATNKCTIVVI